MHAVSKMLKAHDWYYEMSDDHRVWREGCAAEGKLREAVRAIKDLPWAERKQIAKDGGNAYKYINDPEVGGFYKPIFKEFMSEEEMTEIVKE